ncbi:hypothetical protein [Tuwongella immobilis]|uniref:Uncharacterized protein n=1 Tax=Tuwongella immobilis TaxID=692036 RepID=A0A6C2YTD4_9BACT|nr:hypothetical protein [Tuwongella immobilis]VIP04988.1 unnamed protein product [Tuwongella immobilis]VTS07334.1 unnamed protein product [Tuwongella immobilis]
MRQSDDWDASIVAPSSVRHAVENHGDDWEIAVYHSTRARVLLSLIPMAILATNVMILLLFGWLEDSVLGMLGLLFWLATLIPALRSIRAIGIQMFGRFPTLVVYPDRLVVGSADSASVAIPWCDFSQVVISTRDTLVWPNTLIAPTEGIAVPICQPMIAFWRNRIEFTTNMGQTVRIPSAMLDFEEIARTLQTRISLHLWSIITMQLLEESRVAFGPLGYSVSGRIDLDGTALRPWESLRIEFDRLALFDDDQCLLGRPVKLSEIPNLPIFLTLLQSGRLQRVATTTLPWPEPEASLPPETVQ